MPWNAQTFRKHNKRLKPKAAGKVARMATDILESGANEGIAIATANKYAKTHGLLDIYRKGRNG